MKWERDRQNRYVERVIQPLPPFSFTGFNTSLQNLTPFERSAEFSQARRTNNRVQLDKDGTNFAGPSPYCQFETAHLRKNAPPLSAQNVNATRCTSEFSSNLFAAAFAISRPTRWRWRVWRVPADTYFADARWNEGVNFEMRFERVCGTAHCTPNTVVHISWGGGGCGCNSVVAVGMYVIKLKGGRERRRILKETMHERCELQWHCSFTYCTCGYRYFLIHAAGRYLIASVQLYPRHFLWSFAFCTSGRCLNKIVLWIHITSKRRRTR